ncbi:hypothetical protein C8R44DRAFT_865809 [Mycena epipterygia]|nr:hypothetical protein C8R44DRAFT_865809 [Mycena epipterygia]
MHVQSTLRPAFTTRRIASTGGRWQLETDLLEDSAPRDYSMRELNQGSTPIFRRRTVAHPPPIGFERNSWVALGDHIMYREEAVGYRLKAYLPPGLLTDDDPWCPIVNNDSQYSHHSTPLRGTDAFEEWLGERYGVAEWREQVVTEVQHEGRFCELQEVAGWQEEVVSEVQDSDEEQ